MTIIRVYDPALCCSTGVGGVDVDPALVSFSADADWATGALSDSPEEMKRGGSA